LDLSVIETDWATHGPTLLDIRTRVFVEEQGVPPELEHDGDDAGALHLLALAGHEAVGTARLLDDGHIGRMAVLPAWRSQGVGTRLLRRLLELATAKRLPPPFLHAQVAAMGFYARLGFEAQGAVFMDAGIPHRLMRIPEGPTNR
jgi:predicted GNAT family N-acyltransferase